MIPKITQDGPNIVPRYWCGGCGHSLLDPTEAKKSSWQFCPGCGELIEYDKAQPVQWHEMDCERCGRKLIRKMPGPPPYFIDAGGYVGTKFCRSCMEEHCLQSNCLQCEMGKWPNCLQCEMGKWPNCRYAYIKRNAERRARFLAEEAQDRLANAEDREGDADK